MNSSDHYYREEEFDRFNVTEEQQNNEAMFSRPHDPIEEESSSYAMAYGDPSAGRGDTTIPEDSRLDDAYDTQNSFQRTHQSDNQNEEGSRDSFFEAKGSTFSKKATNSTSSFSHDQHQDKSHPAKGDVEGGVYDQHMMDEHELYFEAQERHGKDITKEDKGPTADRALRFEESAASFSRDERSDFEPEYENEGRFTDNGTRQQLFEREEQNDGEGQTDVIEKEPIMQELHTMIEEKHANMRFLTNKLLQDMALYVETLALTEQTYLAIRQTEHTEAERLDQCEAAVSQAIAGLRLPNSPGCDSISKRSAGRSSQLGQGPMNSSAGGQGLQEDSTRHSLQREAEQQFHDDYASASARQAS